MKQSNERGTEKEIKRVRVKQSQIVINRERARERDIARKRDTIKYRE